MLFCFSIMSMHVVLKHKSLCLKSLPLLLYLSHPEAGLRGADTARLFHAIPHHIFNVCTCTHTNNHDIMGLYVARIQGSILTEDTVFVILFFYHCFLKAGQYNILSIACEDLLFRFEMLSFSDRSEKKCVHGISFLQQLLTSKFPPCTVTKPYYFLFILKYAFRFISIALAFT